MRKLVESVARFSWAMSVFGAQQMASALSGSRADDEAESSTEKIQSAFDDVTGATASDLDERFKKLYDAGEKMQHEVFDLAWDVMNPRQAMRRISDTLDWTADKMRDLASDKEENSEAVDAPVASSGS